jgi:hypothetical protein
MLEFTPIDFFPHQKTIYYEEDLAPEVDLSKHESE